MTLEPQRSQARQFPVRQVHSSSTEAFVQIALSKQAPGSVTAHMRNGFDHCRSGFASSLLQKSFSPSAATSTQTTRATLPDHIRIVRSTLRLRLLVFVPFVFGIFSIFSPSRRARVVHRRDRLRCIWAHAASDGTCTDPIRSVKVRVKVHIVAATA